MFTDMHGYTSMMREDEQKAIELRNRHREIFERNTEKFRGTIVQYFGDGTLTAFDSSVDAVECALELQKAFLQEPVIPVRIGIHVGDIVYYENDIIGDAVNIASRIEGVALPGTIFFSGQVNDQLRSHRQFKTRYLDVFHFKNVEEAIPVFALEDPHIVVPEPSEISGSIKWNRSVQGPNQNDPGVPFIKRKVSIFGGMIVLALLVVAFVFNLKKDVSDQQELGSDTLNSIAVLPVQNLSGLARNDLICESITDEILQQLSSRPELGRVVPKSVTEDYLRQDKPGTNLANALGVRYILESALHLSDSLYSLDVRLVDPQGQKYLWSNRYDYLSESNFRQAIETTIGGEISLQIDTDARKLRPAERSEVITNSKAAYDLWATATALTDKMNKESFYQAIPLYEKAIQLDPDFAEAYRGLGRIYLLGGIIWGVFNQEEAATKSREYLQRSLAIKPTLEASQFLLVNKYFFDQELQYADDHVSLVSILPSFPDGAFYVVYCSTMGRYEEGIRYAQKYVKRFPDAGSGFAQMIRAYYMSGRTREADSLMNRYDNKFKSDQFYLRDVAMAHLNMGNMEAFKEMNRILKSDFLDNASVHLYYDARALTHDNADPQVIKNRLDALEDQYVRGMAGSPAWFLAMYHFATGDPDTAFEWLEKSHRRKEVEMVWLKTEYLLRPYREMKDPRYMAMYNQMGWPLLAQN